jgi:zinc transporter ZupT
MDREVWYTAGVGILLGVATFDLLPAAGTLGMPAYLTVATVFAFFHWLHHALKTGVETVAALTGFYIHAVLEGLFVATSFAAGTVTGFLTATGFILHELPEFAAVLGVAVGKGKTMEEAVRYQAVALLLATLTFVTAFLFLDAVPRFYTGIGFAGAGGAFLFLGHRALTTAFADCDWRTFWVLAGGMVLIAGIHLV